MTNKVLPDDETPWESCGIHLFKFKVEGGYLYRLHGDYRDGGLCFVPDAPIEESQIPNLDELNKLEKLIFHGAETHASILRCEANYKELLNQVAELSLRLNKQQSSPREFEKQRVEPIRQHVDVLDGYVAHLGGVCVDINKRIEKLEKDRLTDIIGRIENLEYHNEIAGEREDEDYVKLDNRILKIESSLKDLKIYAEPMQQEVWQENILKRIEILENIGREPSPWAMLWGVDCELQKRIESLEMTRSANIVNDVSAAIVFERLNLPGIKERIEKLESLQKYISDCDKARFDADEELRKRIEKLENWSGKDEVEHMDGRLKILYDVVWPKQEIMIYIDHVTRRIARLEAKEKSE